MDFEYKNSLSKANKVLPEKALVTANSFFQQDKRRLHMDNTKWSTPKIRLIIFFAAKDGEFYTVIKQRPGNDCGSYRELLIAKFRLKLKKVGKITRPFRYDLNQIPYSYTVEVTNRFKRLDLTECLKNYGQRF